MACAAITSWECFRGNLQHLEPSKSVSHCIEVTYDERRGIRTLLRVSSYTLRHIQWLTKVEEKLT